MATEICMVVGQHAWPEHNGAVVEAVAAFPFTTPHGEVTLYRTKPSLYSPRGREIYWQRKHLLPFQEFSREELEDPVVNAIYKAPYFRRDTSE